MVGKRNISRRKSKSTLSKGMSKSRSRKRHKSSPPEGRSHSSSKYGNGNVGSGSGSPEILGFPIQSPVDPRQYKIIRLENGLKALLSSDCSVIPGHKISYDSTCLDERISTFNATILQTKSKSSCKGGKCGNSKGRISTCQLKPTIRKHRNSDAGSKAKEDLDERNCSANRESNKAIVALSVGAGAFNDPDEYLGLAHLCEHMLLLGSEKYPEPGELDIFLTSNGGFLNGTTGGDTTTFSFEVNYDKNIFTTALDMFSNIFISPIMTSKPNSMKAERLVVDIEFQDKKHSEYIEFEKRMQILQNSGKQGHPVCRFSWGNMSTLKNSKKSDEELFKLVCEYFRNYYNAEHMTLVIEAPEPLEIIENWIVQYFGAIRNNGIPKVLLENHPFPYDTNEFRKYYSVVPVHDKDLLFITWELSADAWKDYKAKPLDYISRALSSKSPGSLGCLLFDRFLISNIDAAEGDSIHERTDYSVLFSISFQLTKLGLKYPNLILQSTFSYLKYLIERKPQKKFFEELQVLRALKFHFSDENHPTDIVNSIRRYPPEHVIIGNTLPTNWDPVSIQKYLKMMTPSKANFMIMSKSFDFCDLVEPYFNTCYHVTELSSKLLQRLEEVTLSSCFNFQFLENQFIPTNFCLVPEPQGENEKEHPRLAFQDDQMDFWYFTSKTEAETAYVYLLFMTTQGNESLHHTIMSNVFVQILNYSLENVLYGATEANMTYCISSINKGILVCMDGFSQKIELGMDFILQHLFDKEIVSRDSFNTAKNHLLQQFHNDSIDPEILNRHLRLRVSTSRFWMSQEMWESLLQLQFETFSSFVLRLKSNFSVTGFTQGNITFKNVVKFAGKVKAKLKCLGISPWPESNDYFRAFKLPRGESIIRTRNMNVGSNSSVISNYYQITPGDPNTPVLCDFFTMFMGEAAFQQLREVEKLGYYVNVETKLNYSVYGIVITIQTQSDRFTGNYIKERINNFIRTFYQTFIKDMTQYKFEEKKLTLTYPVSGDPINNWREIVNRSYSFLETNLQEEIMSKLKVTEIKRWYEINLLPIGSEIYIDKNTSRRRVLSIQVVGSADKEFCNEYIQQHKNDRENLTQDLERVLPNAESNKHISPSSDCSLIFLTPNNSEKFREKCITNITMFQRTLYSYPINP